MTTQLAVRNRLVWANILTQCNARTSWKHLLARSLSTNPQESFMSGSNSVYVEEMYRAWLNSHESVHKSWDVYFSAIESGQTQGAFVPAPGLQPSLALTQAQNTVEKSDSLGLAYLIRAYQVRGHEAANLCPLGLHTFRNPTPPPELDHKFHGFSDADLDRTMNLRGTSQGGHKGFLFDLAKGRPVTLRKVIDTLRQTYCQTFGVEYMHMQSRDKCNWIRARVETPMWLSYGKEKKLHIFERLAYADHFERFLGNKYNTAKRFGLDGGESVIPGLKEMIDRGSALGVTDFVFGMPHRGRLNILVNVLRKPMQQMFQEFQGTHYRMEKYGKKDHDWSMSGDVKYHLGTSMTRTYPDGRTVHISLLANPSHLEAVNTVVEGKSRGKQFYAGDRDEDKKRVVPVLMHGDAAFAGQGIVYETMQLAKVRDFANGGTIHIVVNNQVGFTTDPAYARSTPYCTDIGKAFEIPIFHCNGDDPLSVVTAFEMAMDWRQAWGEDVLLDVICYRRHGHNELDQPAFTQPLLYNRVKTHPSTLELYKKRLLAERTATQEELDTITKEVMTAYDKAFEESKTWQTPKDDWLSSKWEGFKSPSQQSRIRETGINIERLRDIGLKASSVPDGFTLHRQLDRIFTSRRKTIEEGHGIDWGTAEALAFGTLLLEGNHVRLTGQDVERGTFSHRHCVLHDQETNETYVPLNHIRPNLTSFRSTSDPPVPNSQARFIARNSILSEYGVLGFETGYSLENPNALTIWEAQFGDFVNGAQIIIDQFIVAGESKWLRQCGLVMLLPHGYDGQGPEHSSCRFERFLQMVDEDEDYIPAMKESERKQVQQTNIQVVNCTTPANYYHVLRRQVHRDFRKPLIVISPKSLLRHKMAVSKLEDMAEHTRFHRLYREEDPEIKANAEKVQKVVMCSGKLYYELLQEREARGIKDVTLVRLEQLAPFPFDKVANEIGRYPNAKKVVWAQEEPKNSGAWTFVAPRIRTATRHYLPQEYDPIYIGREPASAPATGLAKVHEKEQKAIYEGTFTC